jgi:hypothetical protein
MRVWVSWCSIHTGPSGEVGSESVGKWKRLSKKGGGATAGDEEDCRRPFSAGGSVVLRVGV